MMNKALRALCWMLFPGILVATPKLSAQTQAKSLKSDIGLTFTADRTEAVNGADQWLKGGSMELGVNAWHGLGIAARVTGVTISTVGNQSALLNLVLVAFGPRYRWTLTAASKHSVSFYGEALIGEANGFKGLFPGQNVVDSSANAFALVTGGGVDYALNQHFVYRVLEANWARTKFLNGTSNAQNHVQLGSGIAFRF